MAKAQLDETSGVGVVRSVTITGDQVHPDSAQLAINLELDDPLGAGSYSRTVVVSATAPHQLFAAMATVASWACATEAPIAATWRPNPGYSDVLTTLTIHGPEPDIEEDGLFAES